MGTIASELIKEFKARKSNNILNFQETLSIKKEISEISTELTAKFEIGEYDPSHKSYMFLQNLLSYFSEEISVRDEFVEYYDTIIEDQNELMPSYPPMSPITVSFYNWWCLFDFRFGPEKETMGSIFKELSQGFGLEQSMITGLDNLNNSFMRMYKHDGIEEGLVKLRDVVTGEVKLCYSTSKYLGKINEIWFVRISPNLDSFYDYNIILTTPYVISRFEVGDWLEFFKRQNVIEGKKVNVNAYKNFMKNNSKNRYWHNYILDSYVDFEPNSIKLTGIPDIKGSKPHEINM